MSVSAWCPWFVLCLATAGVPAPELEGYRVLARSPQAAQLVIAAREGMEQAFGGSSSNDGSELEWPTPPCPVYVTLVSGHSTRACVGSDSPMGTLRQTVRALGARVIDADRRRAPVRADELPHLRVVIAFAGEGHTVSDPYTVDPAREGLRVESERGAVAFLPGEARTVRWALGEARRLGVLSGSLSEARFTRFPVVVIQGAAAWPQPVPTTETHP